MIDYLQSLLDNLYLAGKSGLHKPRVFKRLVAGYSRSLLRQEPVMRFMDIALSYECNFNCQHCSAQGLLRRERKTLDKTAYAKLVKEAMDLGVIVFHFTGGEPLLRQDLFDIIKVFQPAKNIISVQTNAWNASPDFLAEYYAAGGDILCVSIDSSVASQHDSFRNAPGSWDKGIKSLVRAKELGLRILMSATLTHDNIHAKEIEDLIGLSRSLGATLSFNLAAPSGKWRGQDQYLLTAEDRKYLNYLTKKHWHLRTDFESNWKIRGCPAFKEKCYVSPYGDIMPCPFIPVSFGNVRLASLKDIRQRALKHKIFQKYHRICLAAEHRSFIDAAGCYDVAVETLPLPAAASPLFGEKND